MPRTKRQRAENEFGRIGYSWNSDSDEDPRENVVSRSRRRKKAILERELGRSVLHDADSGSVGKRQVKTAPGVNVAQEGSWDSDKIGVHRDKYEPRPSRRRSRAAALEGTENASEQSMPDTCPPGPASPGGLERAEPIFISSGQQAPQDEAEHIKGIDPDYLAALPEDLRQEVIADHLAQNPQASRTRGRGRPKQLSNALDNPPEQLPQPKKRGRKKKEPTREEVLTPAPDTEAQAMPASIAPAKKKRGRPKKSETAQPGPAAGVDEDISRAYELGQSPRAVDESIADDTLALESVQDVPVSAKAPSKRGRKKKVVKEPPASPNQEPIEPIAEDGRPSEPVQTVSDQTKGPSKRGRKRKVVEEIPTALIDEYQAEGDDTAEIQNMEVDDSAEAPLDEPSGPVEETMPLQDISNTASSKTSRLKHGKGEVTPEQDADVQEGVASEARTKENSKGTSSTTGQGQGKVPFRVGLSKRSRIAPLLKIIRK